MALYLALFTLADCDSQQNGFNHLPTRSEINGGAAGRDVCHYQLELMHGEVQRLVKLAHTW